MTEQTKGQKMNEWKKNNKDTVRFDVPKGYKQVFKDIAKQYDMTLTKLIIAAVAEYQTNHPIE